MLKNSLRIDNCVYNAFEKFKSVHKRYTDYYCTTIVSDDRKEFYIVVYINKEIILSKRVNVNFKNYKDLYKYALNYFIKQL